MLSENMKAIVEKMLQAGADKGALFGILSMLGEIEDEEERAQAEVKILKYILAKGKYVKTGDILEIALIICLGHEQYLPSNMYVKYIGETNEELTHGAVYQVLVSYDNDRVFLIEFGDEEQEVYDADEFEKLDVCEMQYKGFKKENGEFKVTDGFLVGEFYKVNNFERGKYICGNGLECDFWECEPTKFEPQRPRKVVPFKKEDTALNLVRKAMELKRCSGLENRLAEDCVYISQRAGVEFRDAVSIMEHIRRIGEIQLEKEIFLDCALATVTKAGEGCRFGTGERCMPYYIDGGLEGIIFATHDDFKITGIYLLNEPYEFKLDEE